MKRSLFLCVSVVLMCAPGLALAWRALNDHEVYPVSKGVFEVIGRPGSGPAQYWCGAGDFARSQLRVAATQRIYIWKAVGPSATQPGKKAVQFSLTAPEGANTTPGYSLSVKTVGDNLNAASAYQYCLDRRIIDF
jgi:hypothetical protein